MNKVAEFLIKQANDLRDSSPELVAIGLLKQAGMSEQDARLHVMQEQMEKVASESLTYQGIDAEQAVKLVKAANIDLKGLVNSAPESDEERLASLLEKAASYIDQMSSYVEELEAKVQAATVEAETELPDQLAKVAELSSMDDSDLHALRTLPRETMVKLASAVEEPWGLGKAHGVAHQKTDPVLEFLLS